MTSRYVEYYNKNKELVKEKAKIRFANQTEEERKKINERRKIWREKNKDKVKAQKERYKERQKQLKICFG